MSDNKKKIAMEMLEKAAKCKTAEELIALAKTEGIQITKAEAEAYLAELADAEMKPELLEKIAGGFHCGSYCLELEGESHY